MRRRGTQFRALESTFLAEMVRRDAFPTNASYHAFMDTYFDGIAGGTMTKIRAGGSVSEKALTGLFEMWISDTGLAPGAHHAFVTFVERHQATGWRNLRPEDLFMLLCGAPTPTPSVDAQEVDYLAHGIRRSWDMFRLPGRHIVQRSRACRPSEIGKAIDWTFYCVGVSLMDDPTTNSPAIERATAMAEERMGISRHDYLHRAIEWQRALPLSMRVAMGKEQPVGVTIVLPLKPRAYVAVRSGRRASYDCTPDDFTFPSRHLLIECCAERVGLMQSQGGNHTLAMLAALVTQLSFLSALHDSVRESHLRMVSFAGTQTNAKRLRKQDFEPTGATMPRSGMAIMERKVKLGPGMSIDGFTVFMFSGISRWMLAKQAV